MNPEKNYDILIVDDQQDNIFLLKMLLNRQPNFIVKSVSNGQEAVDHVHQNNVDIVLMDVMMPVLDGNAATKKLRESYDSSELPVIMVTTLSDVENLVKSFEFGANDYVTKPIEWNALKARITSCLKVRDASLHEKEMMEQTLTLNKRLKEFSFSVAHDIRNPLAHIRVLCSTIEEKLIPPEDGVKKIDELAEKIHVFMDSILEHSAYGSHEDSTEIDMNQLLKDVISFLTDRIKEKQAIINVEELPKIEGSYGLCFQLIMNLVGNSLKYQAPDKVPEVKISSKLVEDIVVISVSDNGVGMTAEDLKIVEEPLTRGQSSEGTEGSGLGLSLAKNIITEFNGKLTINSTLGEGTTVELSFPKK